MNTKLIIVEGLPGFGKSTTAELIKGILSENNKEVELVLEGNLDHPADYDGVAWFTKDEFDKILSISGSFREVFLHRVIEKDQHYFLPYSKIKNEFGDQFPDELLNEIFKKDIYELPFAKNVELIDSKWAEFANNAVHDHKTYIFECCFIQNPLTIGMIKYGEEEEKIIDYVKKLERQIERLNPVLVYIEQDDLAYSFKKAVRERPKAWSEGFIQYYTTQGFGKQHGYEGIEGTIKVLEARRELEMKIVNKLNIKQLKINNSSYDKEKYKSVLMEKLEWLLSTHER
ncbi:hypothetical protein J14TS2_32690 [Bacillus sp. J14TS2]|uniref:hypothetical protein n=1 Tax=Bacillus sp. J14TS2 TaxID=2807188 RepID=UPI001B1FD5EB|nr:hypothetical protein [Bacillus sp. J14TS2]GIN72794.1 hypothetical protein J14TS2_32690 [Bacillus sp. J14TS2]